MGVQMGGGGGATPRGFTRAIARRGGRYFGGPGWVPRPPKTGEDMPCERSEGEVSVHRGLSVREGNTFRGPVESGRGFGGMRCLTKPSQDNRCEADRTVERGNALHDGGGLLGGHCISVMQRGDRGDRKVGEGSAGSGTVDGRHRRRKTMGTNGRREDANTPADPTAREGCADRRTHTEALEGAKALTFTPAAVHTCGRSSMQAIPRRMGARPHTRT